MTQAFPPKKSLFIKIVLILFIAIPFFAAYGEALSFKNNPWPFVPLLIPFIILGWAYVNTTYIIKNDHFVYKSAFLKGTIPIARIKKLVLNETLWVGNKPALAPKGIVITFNKFDEVYIAPINNKEFAAALVAINPEIQVIEK